MVLLTAKQAFAKKLKHGQQFEKLAQQLMIDYMIKQRARTFILQCENYDYKYDFKLVEPTTNKCISFEVKADKASMRTGNFFIEYATGSQRPSGLSITEAQYYIITDEIEYYLISTKKLRRIIDSKCFSSVGVRDRFLNERTQETYLAITHFGYLVPKDIIIASSKKIN